jgi:hypothetical protein
MTTNDTTENVSAAPMSGSKTLTVEKAKGLTRQQVIDRYMFPRKPVVLQDASREWSALKRWTPDFWIKEYGDKVVKIDRKDYALKDVVRLALDSSDEKPAPYYRNIEIESVFPELRKDVYPVPDLCQPNWLYTSLFKPVNIVTKKFGLYHELFIGGAGGSFPYMHYDDPGTHTFIHQIAGRKLFILFPPTDTEYLYPGTGENFRISRIKDPLNVDLNQYPLFAKASLYTVEIGPGETMFIPCGWWHTAKMLSFSISIGTDILNHTNFNHFIKYQSRKVAARNKRVVGAAYLAYLRMVGMILGFGAKSTPSTN